MPKNVEGIPEDKKSIKGSFKGRSNSKSAYRRSYQWQIWIKGPRHLIDEHRDVQDDEARTIECIAEQSTIMIIIYCIALPLLRNRAVAQPSRGRYVVMPEDA